MKNRDYIKTALILLIVLNIFIGSSFTHFKNSPLFKGGKEENDSTFLIPKLAADPLPYSAIILNTTTAYRLFESINFTLETSGFSYVNYSLIQIEFSNGSIINFNMTPVDVDEYYYEYKPRYDAPLGFHNVSFLIYNNTGVLLNTHTTYTNFSIITNYMVILNNTGYQINDFMDTQLTVNDFGLYKFGWNLTIVNTTDTSEQGDLVKFDYKTVQFTHKIDNETFWSFVGKKLYIKLNLTDLNSGKKVTAYYPFDILNTEPNIISSSINITPSELFRDEEFEIRVNITDIEDTPADLGISMSIINSRGNTIDTVPIDHETGNIFSTMYTIEPQHPRGTYKIEITAQDQNGGISTVETSFTVKNNLPEIISYEINSQSMNQEISLLYGKNLVFTFNVSDVERVDYIKVALIDENDNWYNITTEYSGINTRITIRTVDLITGVWFVYIYVTDSDGAVTSLIDDYDRAPQAITIIPEVLGTYLPWIAFIGGIIIGILVGIGIVIKHYKSKLLRQQPTVSKKKEITSKKLVKKKEETIQGKETLEKDIEETKLEKEDKKEKIPERKIKRKL
ncbi:MAG: hypothetical protein ACXABO_05675 [Promethearchaeota archaeon]